MHIRSDESVKGLKELNLENWKAGDEFGKNYLIPKVRIASRQLVKSVETIGRSGMNPMPVDSGRIFAAFIP